MKKELIFAFATFISVLHASSQSTIVWNNADTVTNDLTFGNTRPKIALTRNNIPIVMWGRGLNKEVYVARHNGDGFSAPVKVTPDGLNTYTQNWVGSDMVAFGDTVYVTFKSIPEAQGYVYVVKSIDGGKSFGDTVRVSNNVWSRFPAIGVRPNGNPIVTYMEFDSNYHDPRYVVCASTDGGSSFSSPVNATTSANGESCDCCPAFVTGTNDETYVMFRNNDNNIRDIWASKSTNGDSLFSLQQDVDPNEWEINSCPSTGPDAFLTADSVLSTWMSGASGKTRINVASRDRLTLSIGQNIELIPESTEIHNYPKIQGKNEIVGVVWQGNTSGNADVLFVWSETGVSGLRNAVVDTVNSDRNKVQMNPDIEFANSTFHVVWQDMLDRTVKYRSGRIESTNNIDKYNRGQSLIVFPNPTDGKVCISPKGHDDNVFVRIFNNLGEEVLQRSISGITSTEVDVSSWSSGIYYVVVMSVNGPIVNKFIVQNR